MIRWTMVGIQDLDREIRGRHLLKHPFYVAWTRGEVTPSVLRSYAGQYYHFESRFPRYVAETYAHLERAQDRRVLLENLMDEEGRDPTHPELWLDFAEAIGSPRRTVQRAPIAPPTKALLATYERLTHGGTAPEALAALYAYESIFPEVAREKSAGLRGHYGIDSPGAHEFFRVHMEADLEHSGAERRILSRLLAGSPTSGPAALRATRQTVAGWWNFLDGFPLGR